MKIYIKTLLLLVVLVMALSFGCSERTADIVESPYIQEGSVSPYNHVFFDELFLQINNSFQILQMAVYVPKASFPQIYGGSLQPVPLLVLLAPEDGDQFYYINNGLVEIADELISNGTIQPMTIACIKNDSYVGGLFYAGHYPISGNYDTLIGGTLIEHLNSVYPFIIDSPDKRAIGGVGQGAYGAFRAAIMNPGNFNSVSAVDGPLDFDGADGNSGMIPLFTDALNEQGLLGGNLINFKFEDTWHISRMFAGGAYAFSPHDTMVFTTVTVTANGNNIVIDSTYKLTFDSTTFVKPNEIILQSFHLPFDNTGTAYSPIWDDFWLPNNLENMLTPGVLNGTNIWVGTSVETQFANYHDQTMSFANTLASEYPVEVYEYVGYDGKPATRGEYMYDLLKEILIFHSDNFGE